MLSFIAQAGCSQQSVNDSVHQYIAVAVAGQTQVVGNVDAAQHQGASRGEGMGVKSYADPEIHGCRGLSGGFHPGT